MIKLQDMLFEIGEGITPYTFRQIVNKEDLIAYTFDTEADDKVGIIMNKGNAFRVMSTVVSIVKTLISKNKQ